MDVREKIARVLTDKASAGGHRWELYLDDADAVLSALRDNEGTCPVCGFTTVKVLK